MTQCQWESLPSFGMLLEESITLWRDFSVWKATDHSKGYEHLRFWPIRFSGPDVLLVALFTCLCCLLRYLTVNFVSKNLCIRFSVKSEIIPRVHESLWHLLAHLLFWLWCVHMVINTSCSTIVRPSLVWEDYSPNLEVPTEVRIFYLLEIGFYLVGFHGLLFLDEKRKDFLVMTIHHIITIALISLSYNVRCYKIGLTVLFLHDLSDIFLNAGKVCNYMKTKANGKVVASLDVAAKVFFVGLASSWIFFRLYWFPLKAIYMAAKAPRDTPDFDAFVFANSLLTLLYIMDVYWFYFVLKVVCRLISEGSLKDSIECERNQSKKQ